MGGDLRKGAAITCEKAEELFFKRLDEGLSSAEEDALRAHEASCEECRRSFSEWGELCSALRSPLLRVAAPPGFAAQVMARISEEAAERGKRKPASAIPLLGHLKKGIQRRSLAAAAVVIALLTGSLSLTARLPSLRTAGNPFAPKKVVEEKSPKRQVAENSQAGSGAQQEKKDAPHAERTTAEENPTAGAAAAPQKEAAEATKGSASSPAASSPASGERVFLNKTRVITTALLKLQVSSLEEARSQALSIARSAGASLQSEFTAQNNGHRDIILRLTAPEENTQSLINRLASVGTPLSPPQISKEDITASFASALKEYQALQAELATAPPEERGRLQSQISFLENQLQRWDEESGKSVIIVLLEE